LKLPSGSLTLKGNQSRPASEASEKTVKEHRPFVAKVVRAFTEPLHFIKTNKEETKALISKKFEEQRPGRIGARALRRPQPPTRKASSI
jgi:ABC-type nitrate/sulfonate/bicarbonate transport system substrate-binding protein